MIYYNKQPANSWWKSYSSEAASFQGVFPPTLVDGFDMAGLQATSFCSSFLTRRPAECSLAGRDGRLCVLQLFPDMATCMLCTYWAVAWAHEYISKQFPSLDTACSHAYLNKSVSIELPLVTWACIHSKHLCNLCLPLASAHANKYRSKTFTDSLRWFYILSR